MSDVVDPFDLRAVDGVQASPTDWPELKRNIVGKLDIRAEYQALGIKFGGSLPSTSGWLPCHAIDREDKNESAAVNLVSGVYKDSGGSLYCAGLLDFALKFGTWGRWIDVVKAYAAKAGIEVGRPEFSKNGRILEEIHEYRDARDVLKYGVFRYRLPDGKKEIRQYPWTGEEWKKLATIRDGQRVPVMEGVEPLPYRLRGVLDAPRSTPIIVVEGEKDVNRLVSLGFVATTSHGGSPNTDNTWPHFLEFFRGRPIVVIPDNNPAGKIHANKVCAWLTGIAETVQYLELPGLRLGGDSSNWFDAGGEVGELLDMIGKAPIWTVEGVPEARDPNADATLADLRPYLLAQPWLWPYWIPMSALTLVAAPSGTGKTRFCFDLFRRVYHGLDWPDETPVSLPTGGRILVVAADWNHDDIARTASEYLLPDDCIYLNSKVSSPFDGNTLESAAQLQDLEDRIGRVRPVMVVIDTINNAVSHEIQDSKAATATYRPLQGIARRTGVAIICVTHTNKEGRVLGARPTEKARVAIQLSIPDADDPNTLRVEVTKTSAKKPPPMGCAITPEGNVYTTNVPESQEVSDVKKRTGKTSPPTKEVSKAEAWLRTRLEMFNGEARVSVLRNAWEADGISTASAYRAKDRMGVVEIQRDNYKWWILAEYLPADVPNGAPF